VTWGLSCFHECVFDARAHWLKTTTLAEGGHRSENPPPRFVGNLILLSENKQVTMLPVPSSLAWQLLFIIVHQPHRFRVS
jgi:hypothetical protein